MQNNEGNSVIRITDEKYLDEIIALHITAFKNVLSGQIGKPFLRHYYKSVLEKGFIYGIISNNQLSGYISGILNESSLSEIKYYFWAGYGILTHIYSPKLIKSLFRHIKRLMAFGDVKIQSELLSIVVHEDMRGRGFGISLVKALEKHLAEFQIKVFKVYTDTLYSTGFKLYEKLGFQLYREVDLFGLPFRIYVKNIDNQR